MTGQIIPNRITAGTGSPTSASGAPLLRAVMERVSGKAPIWDTNPDRKTWLLMSFESMGQYWIDDFLPRRFDRDYMDRVIGYTAGGKHPLFDTGGLQESALSQARSDGMGTPQNPRAEIVIPAPSYVNFNPAVQNAMRTVPRNEETTLARVLERDLILNAENAGRRRIQRGSTAGQIRASFQIAGATTNINSHTERLNALNRQLGLNPNARRRRLTLLNG